MPGTGARRRRRPMHRAAATLPRCVPPRLRRIPGPTAPAAWLPGHPVPVPREPAAVRGTQPAARPVRAAGRQQQMRAAPPPAAPQTAPPRCHNWQEGGEGGGGSLQAGAGPRKVQKLKGLGSGGSSGGDGSVASTALQARCSTCRHCPTLSIRGRAGKAPAWAESDSEAFDLQWPPCGGRWGRLDAVDRADGASRGSSQR